MKLNLIYLNGNQERRNMLCDKIPNLIRVSSYENSIDEYQERLYHEYKISFEDKQFYFNGKRIAHKRYPLYKNKSGTFWHIVSSEEKGERKFDIRRAEWINFPAHILEYCQKECDDICIWFNKRKGKKRVLLWCKKIDYVVVLDERKDYYIFWTAYPVLYGHARRRLEKEYKEYCEEHNISS